MIQSVTGSVTSLNVPRRTAWNVRPPLTPMILLILGCGWGDRLWLECVTGWTFCPWGHTMHLEAISTKFEQALGSSSQWLEPVFQHFVVDLGACPRQNSVFFRFIFLVLLLGSFRYHYSIEVAMGGVILNVLASWITSD